MPFCLTLTTLPNSTQHTTKNHRRQLKQMSPDRSKDPGHPIAEIQPRMDLPVKLKTLQVSIF